MSELGLVKHATTRAIQVGTKAQILVAENPKRKAFRVYNNGTDTVYILSGPDVPATGGRPVATGAEYVNEYCYGEYWIVAASGTQNIRVEENTD